MKWEALPLADRAKLMAAAVRNGYTDIRSIKEAYANYLNLKQSAGNRYAKGGDFEVVNLLDDVPMEYNTENEYAYGGNLFVNGGNKNAKRPSRNERREYYKQQLIIRGLRGAQLEAVLNNMEVESGFNPKAFNKSSGAQGLMQWLGSRKPKSWSEKDQLDYIAATYNKFGGNEWLDKTAYKRFNETTDAKEASYLFRRYWERPEKSSWHATDKFYGKGSKTSFLPNEVNNLVADVSNLSYNNQPKPIFTEADQRLLDTPALAFYNPEYEEKQSPVYKESSLEEAIKLDDNLWKNPVNSWALYNQFVNAQLNASQDDPLSLYMMASLNPKNTQELQQAANWLFNMTGDGGQLYHGLNFAAYGGKVNKFDDGGFSDLPEQRAYRKAISLKTPYTNYEDAIDMNDSIALRIKKFIDKGVSNCTLTASQLYGEPIGRARTIVNAPQEHNFYEVDENHAVPGTMVISSYPYISDYNPNQKYHTMVVTGFAPEDYDYTFRDGTIYHIKKGEPLVNYSRGKASADNYVHNVPLSVYNANSEGKTYNRYYRPIDENYPQVMLPEITFTK